MIKKYKRIFPSMLPIELRKLRELSQLFEDGKAGYEEIKELSNLLSILNKNEHIEKELESLSELY